MATYSNVPPPHEQTKSVRAAFLDREQFVQKHQASLNPVVRSTLMTVVSCVMGIKEFQVCSSEAHMLLQQILTDVLVHGMVLMELNLPALEMWVRDREAVLTPQLDRSIAHIRARMNVVDYAPREDCITWLREQWQATMRVVGTTQPLVNTLNAFPGTAPVVRQVNCLLARLESARRSQLLFSGFCVDGNNGHDNDDDIGDPNPSKRSKKERKKNRAGSGGNLGAPKPGDELEIDLDQWQFVFTGAPESVKTGSLTHVLDVIARFYFRGDPCTTTVARRPVELLDIGHDLWRHTIKDNWVYFVPQKAALPLIVQTIDHELRITSPCQTTWSLVERQHIIDLTDKAVSAQHAARLIMASSQNPGGVPKTLSDVNQRMRETLRRREEIVHDPYDEGGPQFDDDDASVLHDSSVGRQAHQAAFKMATETLDLARKVQQYASEKTNEPLLPEQKDAGPFNRVEADYRRFAEHYRLRLLAGQRVTDVITPAAYDPNQVPKIQNIRELMRHAFSMTTALVEPTPSTKATGLAKATFEMQVNDTARMALYAINALAQTLGLPRLDPTGFEPFKLTDAAEEAELKAAETKLTTAQVQLNTAKHPPASSSSS